MMKEVSYDQLQMNPFTLIGGQWLLVAAGNQENGYNAMTASWGHIGSMWKRPGRKMPAYMGLPTAVVYLRPQRYTKEFVDREEIFTLSVFDESFKSALSYLGTHSGRDGDKIAETGLTPVFAEGTTYFAEAKMVLVCRKVYHAPLQADGFVDTTILDASYPGRDMHEMYVGEIMKILVAED